MTGTFACHFSSSRVISGRAWAASSVFTVTRTSSLPAAASAATCSAVDCGSAVSVLVMDWTTIGWALPTGTPPTGTVTVLRRCSAMVGDNVMETSGYGVRAFDIRRSTWGVRHTAFDVGRSTWASGPGALGWAAWFGAAL